MNIAAIIVGRIALIILAFGHFVPTAHSAQKARQITVKGEALKILERLDGQPVKSYVIVDAEAVRRIESQFDTVWKSAKRGVPEGPLMSSLGFSVTLSDGRKVELIAGQFCSLDGKWRHSETVDELTTAILMTIAKDKSLQWSISAIYSKYPTKEEKEVLAKRELERLVEESRKKSVAPPP